MNKIKITQREIKFRVWDSIHKEMKYDLSCKDMGQFEGTLNKFFEYYLVYEIPIMQFTGLKDESGKEIYEGDIVTLDNDSGNKFGNYEVQYSRGGFIIFTNGSEEFLGDLCDKIILGNLYENPKLLKEGK